MTQTNQDEKPQVTGSTILPTNLMGGLNLNQLGRFQTSAFLLRDSSTLIEHDEIDYRKPYAYLLHRSKSEQRSCTSKSCDALSLSYHVTRVRPLFLAILILFCTDDCYSMPLHTLLTNAIEGQGGSTILIQMLNRLGVCASAHFIQFKVSSHSKLR